MIKFHKIQGDPKRHFPNLIKYFEQDKDIILVYLFGSYATGRIGPLSDVDIAVLFSYDILKGEYIDKKLKLIGKISGILHTDEIDLVVLNEAPGHNEIVDELVLKICRDLGITPIRR